jgi:hypothetical protein
MCDNLQNISLCIPRVSDSITRRFIIQKIVDLNIGCVERVDMVKKKSEKGEMYFCVFIHLLWNDSEKAKMIINRLNEGKEIKVIYDEFWFWKISLNKAVKKDRHIE